MVGDLVKIIAGDEADVESLMGPGVDPHLYEASKGDIERLTQADLVFYNGQHLEGQMQERFEQMQRTKKVVAVSRDIPPELLMQPYDFRGHYDPHIWFDVSLWKEAVGPVVATLSEMRPDLYGEFKVRGEAYRARLDTLHHWVHGQIRTVPEERRILVTAHDAFGYFGSAYEMKVVACQGISSVGQDGVVDTIRPLDLILESSINAVFVDSSVRDQSIHDALEACRAKGAEVRVGGMLYTGAMGAVGSGADTYVGMIEANTRTIVDALK
jgi:manganese/zinc/iron transport system substrate-binding protein